MPRSPTAAPPLSSIALSSPKHAPSSDAMLSLSPRHVAAAAGEEFTDVRVSWELVVVAVPPGPLGILLDSTVQSAAVIDGFGPVDAQGTRGAVELHGGVLPGSVLVSVNHYDLTEANMTFAEIGHVLRETSHLERELCFRVPVPVAASESPASKTTGNEPAEWSDDAQELAKELALVSPASVELQAETALDAPIESAYDQLSDEAVPRSRSSSASSKSASTASTSAKKGWTVGGYTLPRMPSMPKSMPHMPNVKMPAAFSKISLTPPTSIAEASTLLFGPSTDKPDESKFVVVEAPAGSLGLNLDGGVTDRAVVVGFIPLPDGSVGTLEAHGGILKGSLLVKINDRDVASEMLDEIRSTLAELSSEPRVLTFKLPSVHRSGAKAVAPRAAPVPLVEDLDKRRKLELGLVVKFDKTSLTRKECWFVIDAHWMNSWVEFAARGGPPPGPITNEALLEPEWLERMRGDIPGRPDTPRAGLELMKHYRCVTPMVWCLFVELHGTSSAPLLPRFELKIDAEPVGDTEVSVILQEPRLKAAMLANELRDKCVKHT